MARRSFDSTTLTRVRQMPLLLVLDKLRDQGYLYWRRDHDFKPVKDARTVRLYVSSPAGLAWELLITGLKWFDARARKGGCGGIDLAMHLIAVDFVMAVQLLLAETSSQAEHLLSNAYNQNPFSGLTADQLLRPCPEIAGLDSFSRRENEPA